MSTTADLTAGLVVKEGDDRRTIRNTISDKVVLKSTWQVFTLATTTVYEVNLGGIGTASAAKALYVESDKRCSIAFTSAATNRNNIPANGFYLSMLTATSHIWIKMAAASTATVQVAVLQF